MSEALIRTIMKWSRKSSLSVSLCRGSYCRWRDCKELLTIKIRISRFTKLSLSLTRNPLKYWSKKPKSNKTTKSLSNQVCTKLINQWIIQCTQWQTSTIQWWAPGKKERNALVNSQLMEGILKPKGTGARLLMLRAVSTRPNGINLKFTLKGMKILWKRNNPMNPNKLKEESSGPNMDSNTPSRLCKNSTTWAPLNKITNKTNSTNKRMLNWQGSRYSSTSSWKKWGKCKKRMR